MDKEYDVTSAICDVEGCGKPVEARANIGSSYTPKHKTTKISNRIYTYWSCKGHGAVSARLKDKYGSEIISNCPADLFDYLLIKTR